MAQLQNMAQFRLLFFNIKIMTSQRFYRRLRKLPTDSGFYRLFSETWGVTPPILPLPLPLPLPGRYAPVGWSKLSLAQAGLIKISPTFLVSLQFQVPVACL